MRMDSIVEQFGRHLRGRSRLLAETLGDLVEDCYRDEANAALMRQEFDRVKDMDVAEEFFSAVRYPTTSPDDYLYRVMDHGGGLSTLSGIRFRSSGRGLSPFVEVVSVCDNDGGNWQEKISAITKDAQTEYARFGPVSLRVMLPANALGSEKFEYIEQYIYGTKLSSDPDSRDAVQLDLVQSNPADSFYSCYRSAYDSFHAKRPYLADAVSPEDEDAYTELLRDGWAFNIIHDGRWCGFIAGEPSCRYSPLGASLKEIIVDPESWGKGIGTQAHRIYMRLLFEKGVNFLHESIDRDNKPAQRVAKAVGKKPFLCTYMLPMG